MRNRIIKIPRLVSPYLGLVLLLTTPAFAADGAPSRSDAVNVDSRTGHVDYTSHPRTIAHAVVLFEPEEDAALGIASKSDRELRGRVLSSLRQAVDSKKIVFPAGSFTMPLKKGERVRIYLMRYEDRDAYYPIGVFPESYPAEVK